MGKYFGTDGIRGVVNQELDCQLAYKAGMALASVLKKTCPKPLVLIGKDTRLSCDMLESSVSAGLAAAGADVGLLGVMPTPAVAFLTVQTADAGVVVSASHNPAEYNGIKIFGGDGYKLSDDLEDEIERLIDCGVPPSDPLDVGLIAARPELTESYIEHIVSCADDDLTGVRAICDCANGAAGRVAREVFRRLGADVQFISDMPDGRNINRDCGSTHMEPLKDALLDGHWPIGFAFDGDADRCLFVDEEGTQIDGDKMLGALGQEMKNDGRLAQDTIVATVLSNLGLISYAKKRGMNIVTTAVGDRYVLEEMIKGGYSLGGENSGHIIILEHATTGDGILTAVKFLSLYKRLRRPASSMVRDIHIYPQVMINVRITPEIKDAVVNDKDIAKAVKKAQKAFGSEGRLLVRPSGTEPLIRVMAEGREFTEVNNTAKHIAGLITDLARSLKAAGQGE